jgi:hypothetical protein
MPISIDSTADDQFPKYDGRVKSTMSSFSVDFDGSSTPELDINGSLNRTLSDFTVSFRDGVLYPLLYSPRGGNFNLYQTDALSEQNRTAVGLMNACHTLGFDSGDRIDSTPPSSGFLSRVEGNRAILAASPDNSHYLCTYHNVTEAFSDQYATSPRAIFIDNYIKGLDGPGTDDGWAYNSSGNKVFLFDNQYIINNSFWVDDYPAGPSGISYPEWYADQLVQPYYIDPHIVAGIKIGGPGGINVLLDNHQHHSNKSGVDYNNDGVNDDAQDYYDTEEASHLAGSEVATYAYASIRTNMRKGVERMWSNNPGLFVLTNTNQWADDPSDRSIPTDVANLRNCILEYRLSGDPDQGYVHGGFSEGNSANALSPPRSQTFPRSGVSAAGTNRGQSGVWEKTYTNTYQSVRLCQPPAIVPCSFHVECLQPGVDGAGGIRSYSPVPASNAKWSMARWAMCTAWIAGAHASITGIRVGAEREGRASSTPLFDEYGLINGSVDYGFGTGPSGLYKNWMGAAKEDPPTAARADGLWGREFDNAYVLLNPDNDEANASKLVDVSALPGGANEWTRFVGTQDTVINNGVAATEDFNISPIDGIVLRRRGMKWNPGHYVQDLYWAGIQASLDNHVMDSDEFLGAYIIYSWGYLEQTEGVYDWSKVHEHLDWLEARGKKLLLAVEHKSYNNVFDPEWIAPENLEGEAENHSAGMIVGLWRSTVMDQYIAFMEAFAAEFDGHPALEQVSFVPESAYGISAPSRAADYSDVAYSTQLQRMYDAAAVVFTRTMFTGGVNFIGSEEDELIEALYQNGQGRCGPDAHAVDGYDIFGGASPAIRDYRGTVPHRVIVSSPNLGGFSDILPLSNIQALLDTGSVTHAVWSLISTTPGGTKTDIINWIETPGNETYQTFPTRTQSVIGGEE